MILGLDWVICAWWETPHSHMLSVVSTVLRGLHPSWWSTRASEQSASLESQEVRLYSSSVCHLTADTALQTDTMTELFPPRLLCWATLIESQETEWYEESTESYKVSVRQSLFHQILRWLSSGYSLRPPQSTHWPLMHKTRDHKQQYDCMNDYIHSFGSEWALLMKNLPEFVSSVGSNVWKRLGLRPFKFTSKTRYFTR